MDRVQSITEGSNAHSRESGLGLWMVSDGITAERAGIVGFAEFSAPGALELMYALYPRFWGRDLATVVFYGRRATHFPERSASTVNTANQASSQPLGPPSSEQRYRNVAKLRNAPLPTKTSTRE